MPQHDPDVEPDAERADSEELFAQRLRFLMEHVYPRGRGPYTQTEIVDMIRAAGGRMTTGYLSQLRSGKRKTPGVSTLQELCDVFRVPLDYFGSEESHTEIRRHIEWMAAIRDSGAENVVGRTYDPQRVLRAGYRELHRASGEADDGASATRSGEQ